MLVLLARAMWEVEVIRLGLRIVTVAIHGYLVYFPIVSVREGMILTIVNAFVLKRHVAPIGDERNRRIRSELLTLCVYDESRQGP